MSVSDVFDREPPIDVKAVSTSFGEVYIKRISNEVMVERIDEAIRISKLPEDERPKKDVLIDDIILSVCESDGTPVFTTEKRVANLRKFNMFQLYEIHKAITEFNDIEQKIADEKKELKKTGDGSR